MIIGTPSPDFLTSARDVPTAVCQIFLAEKTAGGLICCGVTTKLVCLAQRLRKALTVHPITEVVSLSCTNIPLCRGRDPAHVSKMRN